MNATTRQIPAAASYGLIELANGSGLRMQILPGGELFAIRHGATLINQVLPTPAERGLRRLVLRDRTSGEVRVTDLLAPGQGIHFRQVDARQACWSGFSSGWAHTVTLCVHPDRPLWTWEVCIHNQSRQPRTFDLLHGQDLGLADEGGVRGNEAFISQYIDHAPVDHPSWGAVLLSRQNMGQGSNAHPWLAQGCLSGTVAFATDGFQFFGLGHRLTGEPAAYRLDRLPSRRWQYEFAYAALQTLPVTLSPGGVWATTFFAVYEPNHAVASGPEDLVNVEAAVDELRAPRPALLQGGDHTGCRTDDSQRAVGSVFHAPPLAGAELAEADWAHLFAGKHRLIERDDDGARLSFFYAHERHVVARRKEARVQRPHGHLLRSGHELWLSDHALGCTAYASGVFNAQLFLGNTNLARALSVVRNALDVMSSSGQRVFVRRDGEADWRRLGMPSAFEMGLDRARWIYRLDGMDLEAVTQMDGLTAAVSLRLRVLSGPACEFLISHLLLMGEREMDQPCSMDVDHEQSRIVCAPDPMTLLGEKWPDLRFAFAAQVPADVAACGGDELLFADGRSRAAPYAVFQTRTVRAFALTITGTFTGESDATAGASSTGAGVTPPAPDVGAGRPRPVVIPLTAGLPHLHHPAAAHVAEILPWFAHNACIHFTEPHGLEQYGGAAWGVRDVCQGPVEWLLATRQFAPVRRALVEVFGQQYVDTGCWPQWFMLDPFRFIQSRGAHGDVPFWPVKALCDYLEATGDMGLLEQEIPYTDPHGFVATSRRETVLQHALRVADVFESRRIPGTALVNYGEGDWDDTLQPADPALRANMVSAWTVGLAYHAFRVLHDICLHADQAAAAERLAALLAPMRADFQRLLVLDGSVAGFLIFEGAASRPLLHPRDTTTGIRHRLLPMTRAMLAELFTPEQAQQHLDLIREQLLFPDGARLMSDPVPYRGGVNRWFQRAETAANFGREIGLMYTHAHLRYAEALAKMGRGGELWEMLGRVTPVLLEERVPNAAVRQSNAYFTSSDGAFADRYEAAAQWDDLRAGRVAVTGGWRIYSSGPGLFIHRVICGLLGMRDSFGDVVIDPVLPEALNGLEAKIEREGRHLVFRYTVGPRGHGPQAVRVNGQAIPTDRRDANLYRQGGVRIPAQSFACLLHGGSNVVDVVLP